VFRKDRDKAHLENITDIYNNLQGHQHICVIGDFNLSSLVWSQDPEHHSSLPSNIHQPHEIHFIADINFSLVQCSSPISNCDIHHRPLLLGINFYSFAPSAEYSPRFIFNETSLCAIRNEISAINWESVLSHVSLESCYDTFLVVILNIIKNNARERVHNSFKLPWYTKGLKKLKNLRNKFYKRFLVTQDPGDWNRHLQHKRDFEINTLIL